MVWSPSPPLQEAYLAMSDGGYYAGPPRIASTSRSPSEPFNSLESVDLT
jgi:hypothetical protein